LGSLSQVLTQLDSWVFAVPVFLTATSAFSRGPPCCHESAPETDEMRVAAGESPENSLGMIRVFCSTPLRCGFGFESCSRGGDDESSQGRGDCVVQGCRSEVDRTQSQGVPGPGDLGLLELEIRCQFIILAHSWKSGVSSPFLLKKMNRHRITRRITRKGELTPDYA